MCGICEMGLSFFEVWWRETHLWMNPECTCIHWTIGVARSYRPWIKQWQELSKVIGKRWKHNSCQKRCSFSELSQLCLATLFPFLTPHLSHHMVSCSSFFSFFLFGRFVSLCGESSPTKRFSFQWSSSLLLVLLLVLWLALLSVWGFRSLRRRIRSGMPQMNRTGTRLDLIDNQWWLFLEYCDLSLSVLVMLQVSVPQLV